jgi:hypothetical protein
MSMSESERALLVTGTLDTSGVGGSPFQNLDQVAVAFGAPVAEEAPEAEVKEAEKGPSSPEPATELTKESAAETEPVTEAEPDKTAEKPQARKRTTAKKPQAPAPADS